MKANSDLTRLVYVSNNTIPDEQYEQEIKSILSVAREHNRQSGITGALLFNAGYFAQVLEGPETLVEALFERIQNDDRHENCIVLCCEPTAERHFSKWSMAYEGGDSEAKAQFSYMVRDQELSGKLLSADAVFQVLLNHINQADPMAMV